MFNNLTFVKKIFNEIKKSKIYSISLVLLLIFVILSIIAPVLPYDLSYYDISQASKPPSLQHWFGTDELGRDYFIRVIYGTRISLLVGVLSMIASTFIGTMVGIISGYFGGIIDNILMRLVDVLSSIPWLVLVIVLSVFLKPGLNTIIIVIGCFSWMSIARMVRGETLSIKEREYVMYAKFLNLGFLKITKKHILPSALPIIIVAATTSLSSAIIVESSLSFLGLGVQLPMTSLGSLLQTAQSKLQNSPYMAIIPGAIILLIVYSFNSLGDIIQKILLEDRTNE